MTTTAVIVAAGKGVRMGKTIGKQFLPLGDLPILAHTLSLFDKSTVIDRIILVLSAEEMDYCKAEILSKLILSKPIGLVKGGACRQDSVFNGLAHIQAEDEIVLIHDGVRPFVHLQQIEATVEKARETGACILAVPVTDTLKRVQTNNRIQKTLERETVWVAQTPQVFRMVIIWKAHQAARKVGYIGTDDAQLVENAGHAVTIVPGSPYNIKITTPEDRVLAEAILKLNRQ